MLGYSSGDTKICHFYLSVSRNNNILRFNIPMYNMIVMCSLNAHAYLNGNADRLFIGQTGFLFDIFFQRDSLYQFHHDIIDPVFFPYIIDIYNIRMR